jgi:hypothetical protein
MAFLKRLFGKRNSDDILVAFELHAVNQIRAALDAGLDPRSPVRGKPLVNWLTEMYSRGDNLPQCLRLLLDRGARRVKVSGSWTWTSARMRRSSPRMT